MFVRRVPAIVLSLVLGAAALLVVPSAAWSDGGNAQDPETDRDPCGPGTSTRAKLKVGTAENNSFRLVVIGTVWSNDTDSWDWKLKHNGEVSDSGSSRGSIDSGISFRVNSVMLNAYGTDDIVFRAENARTGEVCKTYVPY